MSERWLTVTPVVVLICLLGNFACGPGVTVNIPDGCADCQALASDATSARLTAFLSSSSPRLVRNDPNKRSALLTVAASRSSRFRWEIQGPEGIFDICAQTDTGCVALGLDGSVPAAGLRSVLQIRDVLLDPGPGGLRVFVSVTVTEDSSAAEPESVTRNLELVVERPKTVLEVSFKSFASRINPDGELELTAIIRGGSPFVFSTPDEENQCQVNLTSLDPAISKFTTPDAQPAYCVAWIVDERQVSTPSLALTVLPLETNEDGETISRVVFKAAPATGGVVFGVEVSDQKASASSAAVAVSVASDKELDFAEASSSSSQVAPGQSVTLTAAGIGGEAPYLITFRIAGDTPKGTLSSSSTTGVTDLTLPLCTPDDADASCVGSVTYTAGSAGTGSELVMVRIEDAVGAAVTTTIPITVSSIAQLSLDAFALAPAIQPGASTDIIAEITGGTPPYTICYRLEGSSQGSLQSKNDDCSPSAAQLDGFDFCTCGVGELSSGGVSMESAVRTYVAPNIAGAANVGIRALDSVGGIATSVVSLAISDSAGQACGDGVVTSGEECDPPSPGNGCSVFCLLEICGNNILDAGEACDDGNSVDGDGCTSTCQLTTCGNGVVETGEFCDAGGNTETCDSDCTQVQCGDGFTNIAAGEQCDSVVDSPLCDAEDCTFVDCGDGHVNSVAGEQCDPPSVGQGCSIECRFESCGNGVVDPGEDCDDGNTTSGDGCDDDCHDEFCGNGIVEPGEDCDGEGESESCNADCTLSSCGDGNVNPSAGEQCDDEGETAFCNNDCTFSDCGDGHINESDGEECDDDGETAFCNDDCTISDCGDGNANPAAGEQCDDEGETAFCNDDCTFSSCGDGHLNESDGEECDDGNTTSGDGCSSECTEEVCGNGAIDVGEECDDGDLNGAGEGHCLTNCLGIQRCGDNVINGTETCEPQISNCGEFSACIECQCTSN